MDSLPTALEREPLIDAVFEVRMGGDPQLTDILPGYIFSSLGSKPKITRLAAHEIPQAMRRQDKNLEFSPLLRLEVDGGVILIGDRNIVVSCGMPYPKWPAFKDRIMQIIDLVAKADIEAPIERYSLKYVNIIEAETIADQIASINMAIDLGEFHVTEDSISLKINRQEGDTLHLMSIITGATASIADGPKKSGVVVDIDSIRNDEFSSMSEFFEQLSKLIESLKLENKKKFFSCITKETLEGLGPSYG